MTEAEVQFVLDAIADNWPGAESDLSDVPLERIDGDNSLNLDKADGVASLSGAVHEHADKLQGMAYVIARTVDVSRTYIGTAPDFDVERVVGVRLEAATALGGGFGAIDPNEGTADALTRPYPTIAWSRLKESVVDAIEAEFAFPDPGRSGTGYKDLLPIDVVDQSANWREFYRADFDVVFSGFEDGP